MSVPEGRGIRVDRPTPIQWNQAVVTPDFTTGSSFGCMPPRDVLLTVGREILSAPPAHNEPPPLCYSSVWLSMNVLVLDPKTVVVEASEVYQQEPLDGFGFEVIPVPFRGACPFGGGLHCATRRRLPPRRLRGLFPEADPGDEDPADLTGAGKRLESAPPAAPEDRIMSPRYGLRRRPRRIG